MATPGADQLAQRHQRDIAAIVGGVTSVVISTALGADIAAIDTWYWGAVDGLLTRISAGYAQSRQSAMRYLPQHAALAGAGPIQVVPGSLDAGRLRERLRITGPVMFKRSIAAGMDTDEAVEAMASRMAGVAEEAVRDGDRDVVEQTARHGKGVVGWRRRIGARACGFCAMLASRGAVYLSEEVALISHRGERYHPHCVPAGTLVSGPTVEKGFRRWYQGELVIIGTASGDELAITPNHPVLTDRGWVPANLLGVGDDVLRRAGLDGESLDIPDEDDVPAPIEQVWRPRGVGALGLMPVAAEDFHGDGIGTQGDVDVVLADGLLADVFDSALCEPHAQLVAAGAHTSGAGPFAAQRDSGLHLLRALAAADRRMEGGDVLAALLGAELGHAQATGFAEGAAPYACLFEPSSHDGAVDAEPVGDAQFGLSRLVGVEDAWIDRLTVPAGRIEPRPRFDPASQQGLADGLLAMANLGRRLRERLAGGVERSRIVELRRVDYSGHVYNLQTVEGWYSANRIIVSNCHCWAEPLYRHEEEPPEVRLLQRQWQRVTAGHSGNDAIRVWRRHWEQRVTPRARQRFGIAAAEPSGGRAPAGAVAPVRQVLAAARSPQEVSRVLAEEYRRVTGRTVTVDLRGSVETAREHAEGILRAVERNPEIVLGRVTTGRTASRSAYAETVGQDITFSERWSTVAARPRYLEALAEDVRRGWHPSGSDSPVAVAIHEAGHVLDPHNLRRELDELLDRAARQTGVARERVIPAGVSGYAEHGYDELVAEAYADVVMNGARASGLSRAIVRLVDAAPDRGRGGVMVAPLPSLPDLSRLPVTRLRAMVVDRGITVPPDLAKPQLVRLVSDLERGLAPQHARALAVQAVLDQRKVIADVLAEAAEMVEKGASARALQWLGRSIRRGRPGINPDAPEFAAVLKQMQPLLDALDAADAAAIRAAIPQVARTAKLRLIGGDAGQVLAYRREHMQFIGQSRSEIVHVIRPGWATQYDGQLRILLRADVQPATPEQVAAVRAAAPAKKAAAKKAAPRKAATAKAPPAPERMTAPALRRELEPATHLPGSRLTDTDIAAVPKPVLAHWVRRWRELPEGERLAEIGRWSQVIIDRQRAVAEALAEASELLANEASAAALGSRAASRLRRIGSLIEGWPHEAQIRALVTAMRTGRPAAIRRAMANAEKKLGLRRIGDEAGATTRFNVKVHRPIEGERIADGAPVIVVRPGYEIEIGGERVVIMRPVVEVASGRDIGLPSRDVESLAELMARAPTDAQLDRAARTMTTEEYQAYLRQFSRPVVEGIEGTYAGLRVSVDTSLVTRDRVYARGTIYDAAGREVGSFSRTIGLERGKLVAQHTILEISRRWQGSGFAEAFNNNLIDWYRRSGVVRIELHADIDVGGYAWAAKGYDFRTSRDAAAFVDWAAEKVDRALRRIERGGKPPRGLTERQLRELADYIRDLNLGRRPISAPEIARFGRQPGQGGKAATWPGKWLMLGSEWMGVMLL